MRVDQKPGFWHSTSKDVGCQGFSGAKEVLSEEKLSFLALQVNTCNEGGFLVALPEG